MPLQSVYQSGPPKQHCSLPQSEEELQVRRDSCSLLQLS
jgi:hypothetical protein